jgi:hypothetical protein
VLHEGDVTVGDQVEVLETFETLPLFERYHF